MGLPISVGDAIAVIDFAVKTYQRIKGASDQIDSVGDRLGTLQDLLRSFKELLDDKKKHALAMIRPYLKDRAISITEDTKRDVKEIREILEIWETEVGKNKLKIAAWAFGKWPGRLEDLEQKIDKRLVDLSWVLQHMQSHWLNNPPPQNPPAKPSPKPSKDIAILFVDPYNRGRGKIAEAFTKLLRERTTRSGNKWGIKFCHSAGLKIINRCNCVDEVKAAGVQMDPGNKPSKKNQMDALFQNDKMPFKEGIEKQARNSRSRGLSKDLFKTYDRVVVFTGRDMDILLKLHKNGLKGDARVVNLGTYVKNKKGGTDIVDVKSKDDDSKNLEDWRKKVGEIKNHVKAFLKQETGWTEPKWGSWK